MLTSDSLNSVSVNVRGLTRVDKIRLRSWKIKYNLRLNSGNLALCFSALLELGHLLALNRRGGNLLAQNDISDFADGQRRNVHTIAFAEVLSNLTVSHRWSIVSLRDIQQESIPSWRFQL